MEQQMHKQDLYPGFKRIKAAEWPKNKRRLEDVGYLASSLAKFASTADQRNLLYTIKDRALAGIFRGAAREQRRPPKVSIDRRMKMRGAAVVSIRLGRGRSLHAPLALASQALLPHLLEQYPQLPGGAA
jgi:hypothetical protein